VLIGSLAQLKFSFRHQSLASNLQGVDVIIGNVITSTVIVWLQESITIPDSFMVVPRMGSCWLTILVALDCIWL
jgi:hypothetical protein